MTLKVAFGIITGIINELDVVLNDFEARSMFMEDLQKGCNTE